MKTKNKKASALVVTLLLCAIIGGAAIGIATITARQVKVSETYNHGLLAFYAAESGLEQGLLYYKHDDGTEIPKVLSFDSTDPLERQPENVYRNFLAQTPMKRGGGIGGVNAGYAGNVSDQVNELQIYYKQKFFGDDNSNPKGRIDDADVKNTSGSAYKVNKDESAVFDILPDNNNIYLYWRWSVASCNSTARALEVKIKTAEANPVSKKDEYTIVFRDPRTGCKPIANSTNAAPSAAHADVFYPGGELKAIMGISALTATQMTLHPIGNTATSGDAIYFGFNQQADSSTTAPSIRVAGPETTVKSVGYYFGTTRQITANIDRQNGTILDLFQYVLYQGQ